MWRTHTSRWRRTATPSHGGRFAPSAPNRHRSSSGRSSGRRGSIFHSCLEQAQQQYAAAATIGCESRPLNLFYGLVQAGRAIAAASPLLRGSAAWEGDQHGLRFSTHWENKVGFLSAPLELLPGEHDLFSRASISIGLAAVPGTVTLNELLSCLPEVRSRYGPFGNALCSMISPGSGYGDPFSIGPPHALGQLHKLHRDGELSVSRAEVLWAAYPGLENLPLPQRRIDDPDFIAVSGTPGQVTVRANDRSETVLHRGYWHPRGSVIYRVTRWLFPYVGHPHIEVHP